MNPSSSTNRDRTGAPARWIHDSAPSSAASGLSMGSGSGSGGGGGGSNRGAQHSVMVPLGTSAVTPREVVAGSTLPATTASPLPTSTLTTNAISSLPSTTTMSPSLSSLVVPTPPHTAALKVPYSSASVEKRRVKNRKWFRSRHMSTNHDTVPLSTSPDDEQEENDDLRVHSSALHEAVCSCSEDLVRRLLCLGVNPNTRNRNLWTPLHDCAVQGNARICTILLDAGSDVRARTRQNSTALHIACAKNHVDIVRCLLTRPHIEIDAVNNVGQTALVKCCEKGFEDLAIQLVEAGADPSIVDASDLSALHYAAYNGLTFLVEVLVDRYPFLLNRRDMNGNTPLHFAAFKNEIECAGFLIERGADLNAQNRVGATALHHACKLRSLPLIERLIMEHASIDIPDCKNQFAIDFLSPEDRALIVSLSEQVRVDLGPPC